jgi:hypothetical protein
MKLFCAIAVLLLACGCQATKTQEKVNELMDTVPNLYYQQVLDNLAMVYAKPGGLPFFGLPAQGTDTNTHQLQMSYNPSLDYVSALGHFLIDKHSATVQGQFQNAQAFQLQPVFDPYKLALLQTAFRWAAGDGTLTAYEKQTLTTFYYLRTDKLPLYYNFYYAITHNCLNTAKPDPNITKPNPCIDVPPCPPDASNQPSVVADETSTPKLTTDECSETPSCPCKRLPDPKLLSVQKADWFFVTSCEKNVPKHACYVGHCCDVWVWVPPEGRKGFTDFTLAILDIASVGSVIVPAVPPKPQPGMRAFLNNLIMPEPTPPPQPLLPSRTPVFPLPTPPQ